MTQPAPDRTDLPTILNHHHNAIHNLINETHQLAGKTGCPNCHNTQCPIDCTRHNCLGHLTPVQPLYMQLWDAVRAGRTGAAQDTSRARHGEAIWIDGHQLLEEIDQAVEVWQPAFTGVPPTVGRLRTILTLKYRPQDATEIEKRTSILGAWRQAITELFDPPRRLTIAAPCPECDTKTVYRRDTAGEVVRTPALHVTSARCECLNCRTVWQPYSFRILADALNCPLPDGVLE